MAALKRRHTESLPTLRIWHWNCRSYRPRSANLQEYLKTNNPDIIALQETNTKKIKLPGYTTMAHTSRTAILVKKTLTAQPHEIEDTGIEHTIVEVLPTRKNQQSLYLVNLYSPPREQLLHYDHFVRELRKSVNGNRLVVVGDFNAPHVRGLGLPQYHQERGTGSRRRTTARPYAME